MDNGQEEQWREECKRFIKNDTRIRFPADFSMVYWAYEAACKKHAEEQRLKNEKALEALEDLSRCVRGSSRDTFHDIRDELETIKSALES